MKTFKVQAKFIPDHRTYVFAENNPPAWLIHPENKWFFEKHVLTLEVGDAIETDFTLITRTA